MASALTDLQLHALVVVYPGPRRFRLADRIEAVPADELLLASSADELAAIVG